MSITLAQGSQFAIAETYGSVFNVTALSNAAEAVATVQAGHGLAANDIIELTSGWDYADARIFRVKTVATNDVTLEGFDTQDTTDYPSGSGVGSLRKITAWQALTQVKGVTSSANPSDKVDVTTLANRKRRFKPGLPSFPNMQFSIFYDRALAWMTAARKASNKQSDIAVRIIPPGGNKIYANGNISLQPTPQFNIGQALEISMSYDFISEHIDYAS